MTNINHVAADDRDAGKTGWMKPEIVSFVPTVESQANTKAAGLDANANQS